MAAKKMVLVRTYSAGVHFGLLASRKGQEVTLHNARRVWSWQGANTLNELALSGCGKGSKISESCPEVVLTQAIEVLTMSAGAKKALAGLGWGT